MAAAAIRVADAPAAWQRGRHAPMGARPSVWCRARLTLDPWRNSSYWAITIRRIRTGSEPSLAEASGPPGLREGSDGIETSRDLGPDSPQSE